MKEWCLRHPILTFLLIDKLAVCISNVIVNERSRTEASNLGDGAIEIGEALLRKCEKEKPKNQIGFRVS